jgi:hypothetical protein
MKSVHTSAALYAVAADVDDNRISRESSLACSWHSFRSFTFRAYSSVDRAPAIWGSWAATINTLAIAGMALIVAGSFPESKPSSCEMPGLVRLLERAIPLGRIPYSRAHRRIWNLLLSSRERDSHIGSGLDSMAHVLDLFCR